MVGPTLGSRTATEQNRTEPGLPPAKSGPEQTGGRTDTTDRITFPLNAERNCSGSRVGRSVARRCTMGMRCSNNCVGRTDGRRTRAGGRSSNAGGENIIPAAAAAAAKTARRQGVPATRRFAESCCSTGSERPHRCCHLVRAGSAGTSESTPQTARRSVQPLWQGSRMYPTDTRTTEHR